MKKSNLNVKFFVIALSLLMAFGMAISAADSGNITKTLTSDYFTVPYSFFAKWETTSNGGIKGTNSEKDNEFYMTDLKVSANDSFIFEAKVTILSGQERGPWAGLILSRLQDQLGGANGGWYNLRWYADSGYVRFVNYYNKSPNNGKNFDYVDGNAIGFGQTHHMKIDYNATTKTFSIFWDGKLASSDKGSGVYEDKGFDGEWYIGVITTKTDVVFEEIKLTAPAKVFEAAETTTAAQTTTATTTSASTTAADTTATTTAANTTAATTTAATTTADTTAAATTAPGTTADSSGQKTGLSGGAIAGIVLAVLVVGGTAGYLIYRSKKK